MLAVAFVRVRSVKFISVTVHVVDTDVVILQYVDWYYRSCRTLGWWLSSSSVSLVFR